MGGAPPKPSPRPPPPVWLAAGSSRALRWAGKHGHSIMLGPHTTFEETAGFYTQYRDELAANGHCAANRDIPMARFVAVADTDEAARQIALEGAQWLVGTYMNPCKATNPASADQQVLTMDAKAKIERYLAD